MFTYFNKFEDPEYPFLGPTLLGLKFWGMWQIRFGYKKYVYNAALILSVFFVATQYVELWIIRGNLDRALENLSVTMLSTVCGVKAGTFILWQEKWQSIIEFITNIEKIQMSKRDHVTKRILREYKRYARFITFSYWCLCGATVVTVVLTPLASYLSSSAQYRILIKNGTKPYPEIMSSWTPFDRERGLGYCISLLLHTMLCVYGGAVVATYDANAFVMMSFFTGQLRLLKTNCERIFRDGEEQTSNEHIQNIRDCHKHHILLIRYANIFNSVLSPVLFIYVIICSLMLCASAVQLTTEGTTSMQRIWIAEYLAALIAQLFLYCWHSNDVLYMSAEVSGGVYASAWWSQDAIMRRNVALLAAQLGKQVRFTAGPFTNLCITTFVAILRGSYSYYTILSK